MIVESSRVNERSWNDALKDSGNDGTIFQSTFWANYAREVIGDHPIYLLSTNKKGNINGLLLAIQSCYSRYPALNSRSMRGIMFGKLYETALGPIFDRVLPYVLWQNGPVVLQKSLLDNRSLEEIYSDLIENMLNIAKARKAYAIKFARPSYFTDRAELMSSSGFEKRRMGTILVNVRQPIESLWRSIDRSARRNISKIEQDVTVAEVTKLAELRDFYDLHVQSTKRLKIKTYPFSHVESLWNFFSPLGKIVAFTVFIKDKPIGASISLMHNDMIHEYAYADSDYARSNRIYVIDTLKWHIIKWAQDRNFRYFDLSGIEFYRIDAGDEKARNIFMFKSKWGGEVVEFHDYKRTFHVRGTKLLSLFLEEGEGFHT